MVAKLNLNRRSVRFFCLHVALILEKRQDPLSFYLIAISLPILNTNNTVLLSTYLSRNFDPVHNLVTQLQICRNYQKSEI